MIKKKRKEEEEEQRHELTFFDKYKNRKIFLFLTKLELKVIY
jgi:hypothetical protein